MPAAFTCSLHSTPQQSPRVSVVPFEAIHIVPLQQQHQLAFTNFHAGMHILLCHSQGGMCQVHPA